MRRTSGLALAVVAFSLLTLSPALLATAVYGSAQGQELKVHPNSRFLTFEDGTPFFYLADTAWELFHRLNREEADHYLRNRSQKGFTVIQAVVIGPSRGLETPNAYGELPLVDRDPRQPNEAYFRHVDYIVNKAEEHGLFVGMLPTWGSYWKLVGQDRMKIFDPATAFEYCRFVADRYKDKAIIWILGGDENIDSPEERAIIEAMADGLRAGDEGNHLITYHPRGPGQSSDYFHEAEWLDFNMSQSSHSSHDHDNGLFAQHDLELKPLKPTVDGEPRYEHLAVGFYFRDWNRLDRFDDYDVRQAAYWSLLAGACGHTYGHSSIWQMWRPGQESYIWANIPWDEALDHAGAFQMGYVRRLFESRPFTRLVPDQSLILSGTRDGGGKIRAAIADDGSFLFVYSPRGEAFTIDRSRLKALRIRESWYDPRYGIAYEVHSADTHSIQTYSPPNSGRGHDWILIIDDESAGFPLPGVRE